ncbi:hypothetical protein QJS04_geneDACA019987 [Acorus gramineus]|uniref:Reverse transcriptase zinc-binding domain-containing protein n=1 Tax=Acorus gramineus TaxID=55184 RepID=A0AAV9B4R9_ACOGR|nr:hypothetical protein QJS04_geneDACA019987 [Acorus gramineus]
MEGSSSHTSWPCGSNTFSNSSSLPAFAMFAGVVTPKTAECIDLIVRRFLWGGHKGQRAIHLVSWEIITTPKLVGGLGLKRMSHLRIAALAYIAWQFLVLDHPIAHFFRLRYRWSGDPWDIKQKSTSSPIWRALCTGLQTIRRFLIKYSGDPTEIDLIADPWLMSVPFSRIPTFLNTDYVHYRYRFSDIIQDGQWRIELLNTLFPPYWVDQIRNSAVPSWNNEPTTWCWVASLSQRPKVKEIYQSIYPGPPPIYSSVWKTLWKMLVIPKFKTFLCLLLRDRLPTRIHLNRCGIYLDTICSLCGMAQKSADHLFMACPFAGECWKIIPTVIKPPLTVWGATSWEDRLTLIEWDKVPFGMFKRIFFYLYVMAYLEGT